MKKRIIFFIFIIVLFDNMSYLRASITRGLNEICFFSTDVNRAIKWEFDQDEIKKIMEYATNLKILLEKRGYKNDDESVKTYLKNLRKVSIQIWEASINTILNCENFGGHKDTFIKNLDSINFDFVYCWGLGSTARREWSNLSVSGSAFYETIYYIAGKVNEAGDDSNLNFDDVKTNLGTIVSAIGHEMMHAFGELEKFIPEDNKKFECIVSCFEFRCFGISLFPSYCRKDKYCKYLPNYCKDELNCKENLPPKDERKARKIDTMDDNFSYASGNYVFQDSSILRDDFFIIDDFFSFSYYPDILVYDRFNYPDLPLLLDRYDKSNYFNDYVHDYFSNNHKVLIIPSGELMGDENSIVIKEALKQFVGSGGTLIVLSQQYGSHIDNLVPVPEGENESLKSYGWREDQSCLHGSVFFNQSHPILSSQTDQRVSAAVDGYFDVIPSNSTVLLQRRMNQKPALFYYPYGNGTVILTSMYTDWGAVHSQATTSELKIVRDLITFAKAPNMPIPMYNLGDNSTPTINLDVKIKNSSESIAAKAILKVYTPDRNRVLYQAEQSITLNINEEEIPISFTLPEVPRDDFGICHVDFELYDAEGNLIQMETESVSGRFAIYKISAAYQPNTGYDAWITAEKDSFYWNEPARLQLHVKNYTDEPITLDWYYEWTHEGHYVLPALTVPAREEINYPVQLDLPQRTGSNYSNFLEMFWLWHRVREGVSYKSSIKGIDVKYPLTRNKKIAVNPSWIKIGDPIQFNISTKNALDIPLENVEIKAFLEKRQWPGYQFNTLATVYESNHNLEAGQTFSYSGTYTHNPDEVLPAGMYRLRTEITRPNGSKETTATDFSFTRSYINVNIATIMEPIGINSSRVRKYLEVNRSYLFKGSTSMNFTSMEKETQSTKFP